MQIRDEFINIKYFYNDYVRETDSIQTRKGSNRPNDGRCHRQNFKHTFHKFNAWTSIQGCADSFNPSVDLCSH